ncbi:MAG: WecB/TagA/CpsF family glycosyltransferase [Bacteroidetes bacterium]|nr:WecB/TagA/CpsF family glycosyltransferase [Bacteroidota bacterium]
MKNQNRIQILGLHFFNGSEQMVVHILNQKGGLLVVPAGPALVNIKKDADYYRSLKNADIIIPDSGYMSLIWNLSHRKKIKRLSGLEFIQAFVDDRTVQNASGIFLVDPNAAESKKNKELLITKGFKEDRIHSYLAPFYGKKKVEDPELLAQIEKDKPPYILINIGGGTQEKLGLYLKENLSYRPAIICTGAAIAFLTGAQAKIPDWGVKAYMGWLFRCVHQPKIFIPRYLKAFPLAVMMIKYGADNPIS